MIIRAEAFMEAAQGLGKSNLENPRIAQLRGPETIGREKLIKIKLRADFVAQRL
jgi:hypothetical protein